MKKIKGSFRYVSFSILWITLPLMMLMIQGCGRRGCNFRIPEPKLTCLGFIQNASLSNFHSSDLSDCCATSGSRAYYGWSESAAANPKKQLECDPLSYSNHDYSVQSARSLLGDLNSNLSNALALASKGGYILTPVGKTLVNPYQKGSLAQWQNATRVSAATGSNDELKDSASSLGNSAPFLPSTFSKKSGNSSALNPDSHAAGGGDLSTSLPSAQSSESPSAEASSGQSLSIQDALMEPGSNGGGAGAGSQGRGDGARGGSSNLANSSAPTQLSFDKNQGNPADSSSFLQVEDPADYFTKMGLDANLFEHVHRTYREQAARWILKK